ncbi:sortase [Candidatus Parcubacteria bacterium]|nr:sortase [Candidatus Parcubacteria bacterium]
MNEDTDKKPQRRRFLLLLLVVFALLSFALSAIGLAPLGLREFWRGLILGKEVATLPSISAELGVVRAVSIPAIKLSTAVRSPSTQDDTVLEKALQEGPVHYPGSGLLGSNQNILLFGHSSGLPVVHNQAYKVFNRLKELKRGDEIELSGANTTFLYVVDSVEKVLAGNQTVEIGKKEGKLILSTCNVWGAKEERFVVTAHFVKSYPFEN